MDKITIAIKSDGTARMVEGDKVTAISQERAASLVAAVSQLHGDEVKVSEAHAAISECVTSEKTPDALKVNLKSASVEKNGNVRVAHVDGSFVSLTPEDFKQIHGDHPFECGTKFDGIPADKFAPYPTKCCSTSMQSDATVEKNTLKQSDECPLVTEKKVTESSIDEKYEALMKRKGAEHKRRAVEADEMKHAAPVASSVITYRQCHMYESTPLIEISQKAFDHLYKFANGEIGTINSLPITLPEGKRVEECMCMLSRAGAYSCSRTSIIGDEARCFRYDVGVTVIVTLLSSDCKTTHHPVTFVPSSSLNSAHVELLWGDLAPLKLHRW